MIDSRSTLATFRQLGERNKHVDNHVVWIDPDNTDHLLEGCDGGLYESWDGGTVWRHFANLSVTQFYNVEVDNASPIYNIYGGTQDNSTLGGPSRSKGPQGPTNNDWFIVTGGDGFAPGRRVEGCAVGGQVCGGDLDQAERRIEAVEINGDVERPVGDGHLARVEVAFFPVGGEEVAEIVDGLGHMLDKLHRPLHHIGQVRLVELPHVVVDFQPLDQ